jgi:adenylosuccinate lyase
VTRESPGNPLHERYASDRMAAIFSAAHRYATWRRLWIVLAECQAELGLPISPAQLDALRAAAPRLDLARVAEIERQTRHDVVAHLRHFAEQAGEAGGILHLGATSAFVTDNTDLLLAREALELLEERLATALAGLAELARRRRAQPCLAYTHLQPAQLTTVGKRACLWAQDLALDLDETRRLRAALPCRGVKGTTGTQASFLTLFGGDHARVRELDRRFAERLGFARSVAITGQTYPRKLDSRILAVLAGVAESCHKLGTDLRLLQGLGEMSEPFDESQVGSSAMAYKRNPVRAERMCGLARRVLTDAANGPWNAATQWLERSLDDSANRRLVLPDAFLATDAVLSLAGHIAAGLRVNDAVVEARVRRELPFMATETLLMEAALRGGDRQELHERLRQYSFQAQDVVAAGGENPLLGRIAADPEFRLSAAEVAERVSPDRFVGRAPEQVDEFLQEVVEPALAGSRDPGHAAVEAPRI